LVFQRLHMQADGRLGETYGVGGGRETLVFGDGDQSFQMAKIHVRTLTPPGPPGKAANRDHY